MDTIHELIRTEGPAVLGYLGFIAIVVVIALLTGAGAADE